MNQYASHHMPFISSIYVKKAVLIFSPSRFPSSTLCFPPLPPRTSEGERWRRRTHRRPKISSCILWCWRAFQAPSTTWPIFWISAQWRMSSTSTVWIILFWIICPATLSVVLYICIKLNFIPWFYLFSLPYYLQRLYFYLILHFCLNFVSSFTFYFLQ